MTTFFIQAQLNSTGQFEDLYIKARSHEEALKKAPKVSQLYRDAGVHRRWVSFV